VAEEHWQQAKRIFEDALRQKPEARARFVSEVCGDDKTLLREVESLLSSFDSAGSFLETPAIAKFANAIETRKLEPGKCFGHCEIINQIGVGGMGEVYLARDNQLDRKVAIKILNEEFSQDESNLQRFVSEAKAASALNHPNILTIYEFGEAEDARFIVSEYIEGKTLREIIRESTLRLPEILDISIQITGALAAAHKAHLVHRDLKPENIMVRPDGYVKVLDFGLAKLVEQKNKSMLGPEDPTVRQNLTGKGVIMGTVKYMSPEQAKGEQVDERTDLFSIGVLIYEMLAGQPPFGGGNPIETIAAILNKDPVPLSRQVPEVPHEVERIVNKALRKDREERYQTAKDLLNDLKDFKQGLAFSEKLERSVASNEEGTAGAAADATVALNAQTTSRVEYLSREIKQHKRGFLAALAVLLLSVTSLGYWFYSNRAASTSARQINSIAVLPFENKSSDADTEYLSDGLAESLIYRLSQLPDLKVSPTSSVFRYKGKEMDAKNVADELGVDSVLTGRITQRGESLTISVNLVDTRNNKSLWGEQYERKMSELLQTQREIADEITNKLQLKLSGEGEQKLAKKYTDNNEAYQFYLKGRYQWNKRTGESLKQSVKYYGQAIEKDPNYALAFSGLAETYILFSGFDVAPANDSMPLAKAAALRALAIDDSLAEAHTALGYYLTLYEFDLDRSENEFRRAIELKPDYATAHQWFAANLTVVKRFDESLAELRLAEELDPLSPDIGTDLGATFVFARRYDEAIVQLKRTLVRHPNFSRAHSYLGWAYGAKGMYAEAIAEARNALELNNSFFIKGYLALWLAKSGNRDESLEILTELKKAASEGYVRPSTLAVVYIGLGDKVEALNQLEKEVSSRSFNAIYLAVLPELDDLRSEPRFKAMLKRMKLPE